MTHQPPLDTPTNVLAMTPTEYRIARAQIVGLTPSPKPAGVSDVRDLSKSEYQAARTAALGLPRREQL